MDNVIKTQKQIKTNKQNILITNQWYTNGGKFDSANFEAFCEIYEHFKLGKLENKVSMDKLGFDLDKIGITHPNLYKFYSCYYCVHLKSQSNCSQLITGFCDVTNFVNYIKSWDERDFFETAIHQFLSHGGIVRVNQRDFILGEETNIEEAIIYYLNNNQTK